MSDSLSALVTRSLALNASLDKLVRDAYDAGFRDGGLAMRDHILQAANAPVAIKSGSVSATAAIGSHSTMDVDVPHRSSSSGWTSWLTAQRTGAVASSAAQPSRAPRGLLRTAIAEVLEIEPGLSISEIEDRVVANHPQIARKSVGNQLRAFEGELYRREGKYNWYLAAKANKASAREDTPLADIL